MILFKIFLIVYCASMMYGIKTRKDTLEAIKEGFISIIFMLEMIVVLR